MAVAVAPAHPQPRRITVLGATGSIGRSTLDLVGRHPERYVVEALTAHRDVAGLDRLCEAREIAWIPFRAHAAHRAAATEAALEERSAREDTIRK